MPRHQASASSQRLRQRQLQGVHKGTKIDAPRRRASPARLRICQRQLQGVLQRAEDGRSNSVELHSARLHIQKTVRSVLQGTENRRCHGIELHPAGRGYAKDSFRVFYKGKKIDGATASSFVVLDNGCQRQLQYVL